MQGESGATAGAIPRAVSALGVEPVFRPGDRVRILTRSPSGHYCVPIYVWGKKGLVEAVIQPADIDDEEKAYGRNAGSQLHYYRVAVPMTEIWSNYAGSPLDALLIEVFESWIERS